MSRDKNSDYYDAGGIEVFDVIKAKLTPEQFQGYLLGNAIKYQLRMMHKTPDEPARDAQKAANYSRWLHEELSICKDTKMPQYFIPIPKHSAPKHRGIEYGTTKKV